MGVTRTEANRYIQLKQLAQAGGGSDPQLEQRVEALETTVDGTGGLVDQIDDLDEQINGDSTATPPVPGIVDEIEALEIEVFGDSTATPPVPGLEDRVTALENAPASGVSYSTTEHKVGTWIDGSDLYEKTVDMGALPNATTKAVAHNIASLQYVVSIKIIASKSTTSASDASLLGGDNVVVDSSNITFITSQNRSNYVWSYVTLQYTKSS